MKGRVLNALPSSNTNFDMFDMIKRAARGKAIGKFSEKEGPKFNGFDLKYYLSTV